MTWQARMIKRGTARRMGLRLPRRTGGIIRNGGIYLAGERGCELFPIPGGAVISRWTL